MNIVTALSSLARNSAHDPEPSIWARETVREMEEKFFAGQDDYQGAWTPAFVRPFAQWLDVKCRQRSAAIGLLTRERDELRAMLRAVLDNSHGFQITPETRRAYLLAYGAERENADPLPDPVLDAKLAAVRGEMEE